MLKINRAQTEFWDQQVVHHEGEKTIEKGGFILQCGVDIRDLIEDPQWFWLTPALPALSGRWIGMAYLNVLDIIPDNDASWITRLQAQSAFSERMATGVCLHPASLKPKSRCRRMFSNSLFCIEPVRNLGPRFGLAVFMICHANTRWTGKHLAQFSVILKAIVASLFHCPSSGQRHASTAAVHEGVGGGVGPTGRVTTMHNTARLMCTTAKMEIIKVSWGFMQTW